MPSPGAHGQAGARVGDVSTHAGEAGAGGPGGGWRAGHWPGSQVSALGPATPGATSTTSGASQTRGRSTAEAAEKLGALQWQESRLDSFRPNDLNFNLQRDLIFKLEFLLKTFVKGEARIQAWDVSGLWLVPGASPEFLSVVFLLSLCRTHWPRC